MKKEANEEKMAGGFRDLMEKRGISDEKAYLRYLVTQKVKKRDASEARMNEAMLEIRVLDEMLGGEL